MNNIKNGWITNIFGSKFHYNDGVLHYEDGPAIIYNNGDKAWYTNGKLHNEDGPAVIFINGDAEWWLNGMNYSFKDYCKELNLSQEQIVKLTLRYNSCQK